MAASIATLAAAAVGVLVFGATQPALASDESPAAGSRTPHRVVELARGLAHPWSLAFLPDETLLISERAGGLRLVRRGVLHPEPLEGLPPVHRGVDGGVLGVALDPEFAANRTLYVCFARGDTNANASAVLRAQFAERRLENVRVIFEARPLKRNDSHFGCRLQFLPDDTLLIALGDGYDYADQAQALDSHLGKIVRVSKDGAAPRDNPFLSRAGALPEIYTLGHRNVQGMALRPGTAEVWIHEHGPRGGDEVNVLRAGANYGWPRVTFGIDYSGAAISERTRETGLEPPRFYWVPSIAPSGMDFYVGERFPEWRGDLFIGALGARALYRLDLEDGQIVGQETLLSDRKERIREVRSGPDGFIYVLTDAPDGKLLRIEPVSRAVAP